jgi:hypothetical protein
MRINWSMAIFWIQVGEEVHKLASISFFWFIDTFFLRFLVNLLRPCTTTSRQVNVLDSSRRRSSQLFSSSFLFHDKFFQASFSHESFAPLHKL